MDPDGPERSRPGDPADRVFDIRALSSWVARELDFAAALSSRTASPAASPDKLVDDYLQALGSFRGIDSNVSYHASWQPEAVKSAEYFRRLNGLMAAYRLWRSSAPAEAREAAQRRLETEILTFTPAPGLKLAPRPEGRWSLSVRVATDIADEAFLAAFAEGVEKTWNGSAAAREAGLRIELSWDRRKPSDLYPEGPPKHGDPIDAGKHADRFGPGSLVLTTGASATNALPARAVFLAPQPTSRHTLAHEFSHLLGFNDGYLRAFEGYPEDPNGVIWHEITPFPDDLLSDPGTGRVTPAMARRLIDAYK